MPCASPSSMPLRRCSSCDEDCRCGCQGNIYSLPWEVLEQILQYEDPITLLSMERTCRLFFAVVSNFWLAYCRRKQLTKLPTPLCVGWDVNDESFYSYDKAIELSTDPGQIWRIVAVRSYLLENKQCVFCRTILTDTSLVERLTFKHDIILCPRCLQHFSITISHDTIHFLKDIGLDTLKLHIPFGPILLSSFIKILRLHDYDERITLAKMRPRIGNRNSLTSFEELSNVMPLAIRLEVGENNARSRGNVCTMLNRHQGCSCVVRNCSSSVENPTNLVNQQQTNSTRSRKFYLLSLFVLVFNTIQLIHSSVIVKDYKEINIGSQNTASFVLVAFIDMSLIVLSSIYVLWNFIRRLSKRDWNQSFATILQCFLLACFLVEALQSFLIFIYEDDIHATTKEVFVKGIPQYTKSKSDRERIDWIQTTFQCCGFSQNRTHDWSIFNNTSATSLLPRSCCSSLIGYNNGCTTMGSYSQSCPVAVEDFLSGLVKGFMCTTVCCCVVHVGFMVYVCFAFYTHRLNRRETNTASIQTIFTMA